MRIKLFETFETNNYYQEISSDEWLIVLGNTSHGRKMDNLLIEIPSNLSKKIISLFKGYDYHLTSKPHVIVVNTGISVNKRQIRISITEDEWFYVSSYNPETSDETYYKCDQFEGLVKFLKDKKII